MTKKRKGLDSVDPDWDEQSRTPARSDVSQDKPLTPSLAKMEGSAMHPYRVSQEFADVKRDCVFCADNLFIMADL